MIPLIKQLYSPSCGSNGLQSQHLDRSVTELEERPRSDCLLQYRLDFIAEPFGGLSGRDKNSNRPLFKDRNRDILPLF